MALAPVVVPATPVDVGGGGVEPPVTGMVVVVVVAPVAGAALVVVPVAGVVPVPPVAGVGAGVSSCLLCMAIATAMPATASIARPMYKYFI